MLFVGLCKAVIEPLLPNVFKGRSGIGPPDLGQALTCEIQVGPIKMAHLLEDRLGWAVSSAI